MSLSLLANGNDDELRVGSKRFTESYILGEILTQTAAATDEAVVNHRQGLGNSGIVIAALKSGAIDMYPEYTGTIAREILKLDGPFDLMRLNNVLAADGLGAAVLLGFNNTYALAMLESRAQNIGVSNLSDLVIQRDLKFGLSQEFLGRTDGWLGLIGTYKFPKSVRAIGLDHGLAYEALANEQIDVMDIYSTDAKIEKYKLRVIADDKKYFPQYDAVILYRLDVPMRFPKSWKRLQALAGTIDESTMIRLNASAELDGKAFATVARDFLDKKGLNLAGKARTQSFWDRLFAEDFWRLTGQHLQLVFVSLLASIIVGIPLGIIASRNPAFAKGILSLTGLLQTIPSLALLAFLIPVFHRIGTVPALVALFLYGLLPIVRNTYAGLTQISTALRESAQVLGLSSAARLKLVELPLAMETLLAGIKTSAVINVGTATIAAFIGAGGYGERIAAGLALNDNALLLAGAIPAASLALMLQWSFDWLDRFFISPGLLLRQKS
jgi:osmoprotectant transport system permease protein